ncbi:hypothetical protein M514_18793, partial [Trichuris suis]
MSNEYHLKPYALKLCLPNLRQLIHSFHYLISDVTKSSQNSYFNVANDRTDLIFLFAFLRSTSFRQTNGLLRSYYFSFLFEEQIRPALIVYKALYQWPPGRASETLLLVYLNDIIFVSYLL